MPKQSTAIETPQDALREIVDYYEQNASLPGPCPGYEAGYRAGLKTARNLALKGLAACATLPQNVEAPVVTPPAGPPTCPDCGEYVIYRIGEATYCCHCGKLLAGAEAIR